MKKAHIFLLVFIMLIGLTLIGCNKLNSNEGKGPDSQEDILGETGNKGENSQGAIVDPKSFAIVVDSQLKGIDLIKAAKITSPVKAITYDIKTVIGSGEYTYETVGKVMKSGPSYRTDIEVQGEGVEVTIYNADEKMTYKYNKERKEGYKYQDDESAGEGPTISNEYDLTMSYIDENNLAKAEVIQYEGEPVMYFEIVEGNNRVNSWISLRYGMTIKTEMYDGETLVSHIVISNITLPASISATNFIPPNDIILEDYSTNNQNGNLGPEGTEVLEGSEEPEGNEVLEGLEGLEGAEGLEGLEELDETEGLEGSDESQVSEGSEAPDENE